MSTLQTFLADSTKKAADDLLAAFDRIPADKQSWSPMGDARTALDQLAECALLTGVTAQTVESRKWLDDIVNSYPQDKQKLLETPEKIKPLLQANTQRMAAAVGAVTDQELAQSVSTAFGEMTWSQIVTYPYWNMSYHQGQINYIASMLGCLS